MKKWIKEHKKLCIILAVVLVVVLVIIGVAVGGKKKAAGTESRQEITTVERRTLAESVSATGTFEAADHVSVTSEATNTEVLSVNVKVGDAVTAGQVLCRLDTEDLDEQLADARDSLGDTEDQKQRTIDRANRNLEDAKKTRDEDLSNVDPDISDAYDDWQESVTRYQELKADYEAAVAKKESMEDGNGNVQVQYQGAYWTAAQQVTSLKSQMDSAKTTMDRNEKTYTNLRDNREDTIRRINDTYQDQLDNYNDTMESVADAGDNQRDQIERLEEQIDSATVTAPISGIVTAVNVEAGDDYNGGIIVMIKNVDMFNVTTEIDEYDINKIQVGQTAVIRTNATGDLELSGTVTEIAPEATGSSPVLSGSSSGSSGFSFDMSSLMGGSTSSGSSGSGDVTYTVTIRVDTPCDQLKIGMTAKLSIILQQSSDVLSVAFNALQQEDDGTYYVEAVQSENEDGTYTTKKITVNKGIESDYYVEVSGSGIEEGLKILVPQTEGSNRLEDLINSSGAMGGV